jgi:catechol 2,3-dioxygenase-like lactoylglutathione lyase family enzyme
VLGTLGIARDATTDSRAEWGDFFIAQATAEHPVTRRLHLGFAAASREAVDAFWDTGTRAGYRDDGEPGPRPQYRYDYYGSFLLDPDGNSAEAVHHGAMRGGAVDHLWIRVADVAASRAFYEAIAPHAGLSLGTDTPERAQFRGAAGTFSVLAGEPTEQLHMAFPAREDETVAAFHRAALAAGHRDNGGPGERAAHDPGYYSAYVLDPDGNNIEVVSHNR